MLPELDSIILRGRPEDVAKLKEVFGGQLRISESRLKDNQGTAIFTLASGKNRGRRSAGTETASATNQQHMVKIDIALATTSGSHAERQSHLGTLSGDLNQVRQRLEELRAADKITLEDHVRINVMSGEMAEIESGGTTPTPTSVQQTRGGQQVFNYQTINTGLNINVTPLITDDGIQIKHHISRSYLPPAKNPDASGFIPQDVSTLSANSTVTIPSGQALAYGLSETASNQHWIVIVAAELK